MKLEFIFFSFFDIGSLDVVRGADGSLKDALSIVSFLHNVLIRGKVLCISGDRVHANASDTVVKAVPCRFDQFLL